MEIEIEIPVEASEASEASEEDEPINLTTPQKTVMDWLQKDKSVLLLGFTQTGKSFVVKHYYQNLPKEKKEKILVVDNVREINKESLEKLRKFQGQKVVVMSQFDSDDSEGEAKPCNTRILKNRSIYGIFDRVAIMRRPYVRDQKLVYHWDSHSSDSSSESE